MSRNPYRKGIVTGCGGRDDERHDNGQGRRPQPRQPDPKTLGHLNQRLQLLPTCAQYRQTELGGALFHGADSGDWVRLLRIDAETVKALGRQKDDAAMGDDISRLPGRGNDLVGSDERQPSHESPNSTRACARAESVSSSPASILATSASRSAPLRLATRVVARPSSKTFSTRK